MPLPTLLEAVLLLLLLGVCLVDFRHRRRLRAENHRLQKERKLVVDFMHELAVALEETPSKDNLVRRIVRAAIESTGATSACLYEQGEDHLLRPLALEGLFPPQLPLGTEFRNRTKTRAAFLEQLIRGESLRPGQGIIGQVAQDNEPVYIRDGSADARVVRHGDASIEVHSMIAVPLRFNQRCFGVLALANPAHGEAFTETDFELVSWLAEQASLALHNADFLHLHLEKQQMDLDLSLTRSIQTMLLAGQTRSQLGLDVDLRYAPAQRVGGDLHDLFELPGGKLGVAIADVSGKGVPAALLMTGCRSHLRQIAPRHASPAKVLSELNRAMLGDVQQGMYVTVAYAVIDPEAGLLCYARAGHEQPLLVKAGEAGAGASPKAQFLLGEGLPVGMVGEDLFETYLEEQQVPFLAGDVLVLYTDGITEAANADQREFSGGRLVDAVCMARGLSAEAINNEILAAVERFTDGQEQRDDYTLVAVRRL